MRKVEGGRKKRSPVKVGFLLLQAGFNFRLFRDRDAGLALDNFCQHVDHRGSVFDDQGVGRFIGHDTAFRRQKRLKYGGEVLGVSVFKLYHADDDTPAGRGCLFLGQGKTRSQQHQEKNEDKKIQKRPTSLGEAAML